MYLLPQQKRYESIVVIRRSCSILARSHERICRPGKSNFSHVTGGLMTATISVNVGKALIFHRVPKRKNISMFTSIDRILYPDGVR